MPIASNIRRLADKVREINARYREPQIEMSRAVRMALMALRIYLLLLVCLIVYKFVLILN
ncbi:MAG: hypothetical protein HQL66_09030 [Magnetococcales bacterium]|nr:hypothetical protein [Magnetococcales bacterium]